MVNSLIIKNIFTDILKEGACELESALCDITKAEHCIVFKGSNALEIIFKAEGICHGDEVLLPALATKKLLDDVENSGVSCGFADINPGTWVMDSFCLEYAMQKNIRRKQKLPKAVVTQNLFGVPCDYSTIEAICEHHGVLLLEDMQGSLGAKSNEKSCGTFGNYSYISEAEEDISVIFTQSTESYVKIKSLVNDIDSPVSMDCIKEKIKQIQQNIEKRKSTAEEYKKLLSQDYRFQSVPRDFYGSYSGVAVLMQEAEKAESAQKRLFEKNLQADTLMPCVLHKEYSNPDRQRLFMPNAEDICEKMVLLPIHAHLNAKTINKICNIVMDKVVMEDIDE